MWFSFTAASWTAPAGRAFLDREKFHDSFAADVSAEDAAFTADSQVPCHAIYVSQPNAVASLIEKAASG